MAVCCLNFAEVFIVEQKKIRGISVFRRGNGIYFLRFSCVDGENENKLIEMLRSNEEKEQFYLSISGEEAIQYCPWCGSQLI